MKFHMSNGRALKCDATVRDCPLGLSPNDHYSTKGEAYAAYAARNEHNLFNFGAGSSAAAKVKRFLAVAGVLASTFSVAACGTIDTDEQPEWKAYEQQQSDKNTQDGEGKVKEAYNKAKDYSKEKWEQAKEKAQQQDGGNNTNTGNGDSGGRDDIFFQGKSITPTADEVAKAKEQLSNLDTAPENDVSDYNRKEMFGDFDKGTVAAFEQRDITYNASFNDDGRAEDGSAFVDPYTGKVVTIVKGSSHDADVDHLVPLKEVLRSEKAGKRLTVYQRHQIANDMDNLQLVGSSENRSKSDRDAATYIPSFEPTQCVYVVKVIAVKSEYDLNVDPEEREAMEHTLSTKCG